MFDSFPMWTITLDHGLVETVIFDNVNIMIKLPQQTKVHAVNTIGARKYHELPFTRMTMFPANTIETIVMNTMTVKITRINTIA